MADERKLERFLYSLMMVSSLLCSKLTRVTRAVGGLESADRRDAGACIHKSMACVLAYESPVFNYLGLATIRRISLRFHQYAVRLLFLPGGSS
jgi:hypothetical protein